MLARARGVDIRSVGSGNIGATNVTRALGKKSGQLVFILDFLKGLLPVVLFAPAHMVALAAVSGHCFSIFLKCRGGKGVATGIGALLGVAPLQAISGLLVFALVYKIKKIVSLASILATATVAVVYLSGSSNLEEKACIAVIAVIIIGKHHSNIKRLFNGTER